MPRPIDFSALRACRKAGTKGGHQLLSVAAALTLAGLGIATASRADVTANLACPSWQAGQTGTLHVSGGNTPLHLTVTHDGSVVWEDKVTPRADGTYDTNLPLRQPGYYTLSVEGGPSLPFAIVPPLPRSSSDATVSLAAPNHRLILGVCTHFAFSGRDQSDASFTMLKNMGIDMVRDELPWGAVEPEKGKYTFRPQYDYVEKLRRKGIQLMIVAGYNNALYGPGRKPPVGEGTQAFGRYCVEMLKHYGSGISALEVYNEPNDFNPVTDYLPLLRDTCTEVRAAGLTQPIIAVGGAGIGGGMNPDFAAKLFAAGGAAYCDSFSQHPYTSPHSPDLGYGIKDGGERNANLDLALRRSSSLLDRYGKPRGAWITETGWPAPVAVSEKTQAAYAARALLTASAYPHLEGIILYDFEDDGANPTNKEHHFGLVHQDLTPKPAFQAYAVAAHFLKDKTFVRQMVDRDSRLMANVYRDHKGTYWIACWATEQTLNEVASKVPLPATETPLPIALSAPPNADSYDWEGRPLTRATTQSLSSLPTYIEIGSSDTVTLKAK